MPLDISRDSLNTMQRTPSCDWQLTTVPGSIGKLMRSASSELWNGAWSRYLDATAQSQGGELLPSSNNSLGSLPSFDRISSANTAITAMGVPAQLVAAPAMTSAGPPDMEGDCKLMPSPAPRKRKAKGGPQPKAKRAAPARTKPKATKLNVGKAKGVPQPNAERAEPAQTKPKATKLNAGNSSEGQN